VKVVTAVKQPASKVKNGAALGVRYFHTILLLYRSLSPCNWALPWYEKGSTLDEKWVFGVKFILRLSFQY